MKHRNRLKSRIWAAITLVSLVALPAPLAFGQKQSTVGPTPISYHKNRYSPQDDVQIGREAAAQAERQLRIMPDAELAEYLESVGEGLVRAIPPEFQHPEFRYYFKVVEDRSINAFALPGGPMYVNTGAIMAAHNEGELAGVMAHELSHVALRHGTAQATKAQSPSLLAGLGQIGGAILGGPGGAAVSAVSQIGGAAFLLRYSREYETEADLLGARIMANAGYDPHDLANMFQTIQQQSGGSNGGGWFSDHPSSKDRYAKINAEAARLQVAANPIKVTAGFREAQQRINGGYSASNRGNRYPQNNYPRNGNNYPSSGNNYPSSGNNYPSSPIGRVEPPSSSYRSYNEGTFAVSIPNNWRQINEQGTLWFAPNGAYGSASNGQTVFTHAVNFGTLQSNYRNLQQATDNFVNGLQRANGNLRSSGGYQRMDVAGRSGLLLNLENVNEATGRPEVVNVVTAQLRDGRLFYMLAISPRSDYSSYQNTFLAILRSVQLND